MYTHTHTHTAAETLDYELFKSILSNREVDDRHVNRLVDAISKKNLLHLNPILCNKNHEVIDGQHRLEAARKLGVPIYYIIDEGITKGDIATINSNAKNWSVTDYVNYWTIEKREGFDKLSAFLSEHPAIPASTALSMMSVDGSRNTKALKDGIVDTSNYDRATYIAGILKEYRNLIDHAYERNFIMAVTNVVTNPDYDHAQMRSQLEFQSRSLVRCINTRQYVELLEEIYNRNKKNRVKF